MLAFDGMLRSRDADDQDTLLQSRYVPSPEPATSAFTLTVVDGADRGMAFTIQGSDPAVLLGQSAVCAVRLSDPEVSRRHASLEIRGSALRVADLGSTNGTRVDRLSVEAALLRGGEVVEVGSTRIRVDRATVASSVLPDDVQFGRLLGASREMRRLYPLCRRLAASLVPVMIEGETGSGKEVLAEALHEEGPRAAGPFVVFDCTAVHPSLMEAELFGHERGAFTGAVGQRTGLFEQAKGGTLFLDEIGDLAAMLQPKLLRAVERGEVRRVGGDRWIKVDARIIAATRRNLDQEVQEGRFRDDIGQLASHFWRHLGGHERGVEPDVLARWEALAWPGNVRELRNAVAREIAVGDLDLAPRHAAVTRPSGADEDFIDGVVAGGIPLVRGRSVVVEEYERRYIERVLLEHGGNVVHAARASGIARRHFQRLRARTKKV